MCGEQNQFAKAGYEQVGAGVSQKFTCMPI